MTVQEFFSGNNIHFQYGFYVILFLACWNIEYLIGVTQNYKKWKHSAVNFWFIIPGGIIQGLLGIGFAKFVLYENTTTWGLHQYDVVTQLVVVFIVLDLGYYLYHYLMHKIKKVWIFHAVHHSDTVLNVSTSLREHPVETIIRLSHYMLLSILLAPSFWILAMHQFIQVTTKIFIHSNFKFSERLDRYLSYIFITPNMHHVHHHYVQPYTDSNFGDLFSVWDRMFGTFQTMKTEEIVFGVDINEGNQHLGIKDLIRTKFPEQPLFPAPDMVQKVNTKQKQRKTKLQREKVF